MIFLKDRRIDFAHIQTYKVRLREVSDPLQMAESLVTKLQPVALFSNSNTDILSASPS